MKFQTLICIIILILSFNATAQKAPVDSIKIPMMDFTKLNQENATMQKQLLDLQNELIALGVHKTITFKYNGEWVTYGVVSHGNRYWMDRNLGAKRAATSLYDTLSVGDFYQWGRAADGHQLLNNTKVCYTKAKSGQQPGNDSIIKKKNSEGNCDWNANSNWTTRWEDGTHNLKISTNVCPDGWHVPTMSEWGTAIINWTNEKSGFESPLKLSIHRGWLPNNQNTKHSICSGGYWSSTPEDNIKGLAWYLFICEEYVKTPRLVNIPRIDSNQIRCIKDR
jgi:uncharacterized protein (TIGR02145 family)